MAFKNTNLSLLAYNTGYILRRNALISRILSQSSGKRFTPGNGYTYEIFTQAGQFTVSTPGYMDVLLVAGGGGGGSGGPINYYGGGGGAGGMKHQYNYYFSTGQYGVTIGQGGTGGSYFVPTNDFRNAGQNGTVTAITAGGSNIIQATGGGGGSSGLSAAPPGNNGAPGGSGGGAGSGGGKVYYGSGTSGQGHPGGGGNNDVGGGGGGAGSAGNTGPGGDGLAAFSGDTGIPTSYGFPGPTPGRFFALGGLGGGIIGLSGSSGALNTGQGGAGNSYPYISTAFPGGPGIVILRYVTSL